MDFSSSPEPRPSPIEDPLQGKTHSQSQDLATMRFSSSPEPGLSSTKDPLQEESESLISPQKRITSVDYTLSSPQPGPSSSAKDHLEKELAAMMSPGMETFGDIRNIDFIDDIDLYGILTETSDDILDECTYVEDVGANVFDEEGDNVSLQDELNEGDNIDLEPTNTWNPGNPINMMNIPFLGAPEILPPHRMTIESPLDYLFLFLNNEIVNLIISQTNKYGNKLKTATSTARGRFKKWVDLDEAEFKTFLGILLLMGTIKLNRMVDYWSSNYLFKLSPRLFMARDRFYLILRALNVQNNDRPESLFKIKPLVDLFNKNINSIYSPTKELTIDESLILWKGRLQFRQYLKGKAHRYGIKLYILADANGIILKIHIYAGSQDQIVGGKNHVKKVVMLLMEKYTEKGHSLYLDNFYTSVGLADQLLDKNTYVTGTLRPNRAGNPSLAMHAKLNPGESCIVHNNKKIVVTRWRDKREIMFLSTEHTSKYVMTTSRRIRTIKYKPAVQVKYNKYMRAIDRHDQLLSYYCCEHKTLRWYKKVIIHFIQICLINGFLLYKIGTPQATLYNFRKIIIESLLPQPIPIELSRPLSEGKIHLPASLPKRDGKILRKRCRICYSTKKRRVATSFGCPDCPGFPGLCPECFREYHKY